MIYPRSLHDFSKTPHGVLQSVPSSISILWSPTKDFIICLALALSRSRRSLWGTPYRISSALMLSRFAKTISCWRLASSRILPGLSGCVCLHSFAVTPNRATFRASASPAQVRLSRRRDISRCANIPPYLPALEKIPIALGRVAPLFRRRGKYVGPSLHPKPVEFDGFRAKVVGLRILDMKKVNICLMFLDYSLDGPSSSRFTCSAVLSIISMTTWLSCAAFFDVMTDFPVSASMACLA